MDFDYSPSQKQWVKRVTDFMDEHIVPAVPVYEAQMAGFGQDRWKVIPIVEALKAKAKAAAAAAKAVADKKLHVANKVSASALKSLSTAQVTLRRLWLHVHVKERPLTPL